VYTSKDKVRCMMVAANWRIEGYVHVLAGSRLTDALNSKAKDFIAVTEAVVSDATTGAELYRPSYVAVNRESMSVVIPLED